MAKTCPTCSTAYPDAVVFCPLDGSGLIITSGRDDLIGEVIADMYLVTNLLGQGGMGTVYHAQHVRLPLQVAIKILHANRSSDPAQATRFRQEAESASRIDHDRVARVYDFGTTAAGEAYIAMEYVPGRTLSHLMEEKGALNPLEVAQIVFMVAEGLDAAHRIGIIHRDLKPENIMVVDDAEGSIRVKVLDFGIAKMVSGPSGATLTQHGFIIGSPPYMSPEQVLGGELDARSDIYALGLLAFVMLAGMRPFSGATPEAEMLARLTGVPLQLAEAAPGVGWPAELQALFDRTLARDVAQRPARAKIFADEFFNTVNTWKGATRPPGMITSGSISQPPFTVSATTAANVPRSAELPAPVQNTHSKRWAVAGVGVVLALAAGTAVYQVVTGDKPAVVAAVGTGDSAQQPAAPTVGALNSPSDSTSARNADRILATGSAEKPAPVTVDITKPIAPKPVAPAAKPGDTPARSATPQKLAVVDSAAIAAANAAATSAIKAPVVTPESKSTAPEPPAKSTVELNSELKASLRAYADAIESHDLGRLRTAYPGIPQSLLDQYGTFFQFASKVKVSINAVDLSDPLVATVGSKVHARVNVTINYRNDSKRKDEHDASSWQALLNRTATGWQLLELR